MSEVIATLVGVAAIGIIAAYVLVAAEAVTLGTLAAIGGPAWLLALVWIFRHDIRTRGDRARQG